VAGVCASAEVASTSKAWPASSRNDNARTDPIRWTIEVLPKATIRALSREIVRKASVADVAAQLDAGDASRDHGRTSMRKKRGSR
jgi:hypothetical protein